MSRIRELLKETSGDNPLDPRINLIKEKAKITLREPNTIIRVKPMNYTPQDRKIFEEQINELVDQQVIKPSKSSHSSPAFLVEKESERSRGKKRMVINYNTLNKETMFDGYYLPNNESLICQIRGRKIFSGLDC